jgi:hypothetical protein
LEWDACACRRRATAKEIDAVTVLHTALDQGVNLLDTADAYCWDDHERGHNERLIARALASWAGDRACVTVATKGGMTRRPVAVRSARNASTSISCTSQIRLLAEAVVAIDCRQRIIDRWVVRNRWTVPARTRLYARSLPITKPHHAKSRSRGWRDCPPS